MLQLAWIWVRISNTAQILNIFRSTQKSEAYCLVYLIYNPNSKLKFQTKNQVAKLQKLGLTLQKVLVQIPVSIYLTNIIKNNS